MALVPYERPRGAVHDLTRLAEISSDRCRILCVSDRTLYLLANLAAVDISFFARFAVELKDTGYIALDRADPEYDLYEQIKTAFQLEVLDMTCDIESGLLAIADAIASQSGGGGGCGGEYASPVLNCIVNIDNEEILGPGDSTQGNPGVDDPPDDFETWEEYFVYKCKAAAFIWDLQRKHMVMLRNFEGAALVASIVGPSVAGLLGVLPAAMTPAGFAVFVGSVVAIGAVAAASWFYMDEMIDEWDANKDDIICSLYSSGSSVQAVSALSNALEDALQAIVTWGALGPVSGAISGLLGTAFSQIAGNGIVEPLFKAVVAATEFEYECDACGGDYVYAAQVVEWGCWDNTAVEPIECGTVGVDVEDEDYAQGWADDYGLLATRTGPNAAGAKVYILFDFGSTVICGDDAEIRIRYRQPEVGVYDRLVFCQHQIPWQQVAKSADGENFTSLFAASNAWAYSNDTGKDYEWGPIQDISGESFRYLVLAWDINYDIGAGPNAYGWIDSITISDSTGGVSRGQVGW